MLKFLLYQIISAPFQFLDYSIFQAISNADFWQIAGIAALEIGNPNVNITFKGGRVDCTSSPNDEALHQYPDPIMSRTEMLDWFANNDDGFGMDANQVKIY